MEVLNEEVANKVHDCLKEIDYQYYYLDNNATRPIRIDRITSKHHLNTNFLICTPEIANVLNLK